MTAPQKIVGLFFYLKVTQKHTSVVQSSLEYCIIKNMRVDGSTVHASDDAESLEKGEKYL